VADLDTAKFSLTEAASVAGIKPATGQSWIKRGWLKLARGKDKPAKVAGATTLLSFRRVLQMTIAARLVAMGTHPQVACKAAHGFTDFSSNLEAPGHDRDPGELFAGASTALAVYSDGHSAVLRMDKKTSLENLFFPLGGPASRYEQATALFLDFIVKHVTVELEKFHSGARS
jgi:hypothetical protein